MKWQFSTSFLLQLIGTNVTCFKYLLKWVTTKNLGISNCNLSSRYSLLEVYCSGLPTQLLFGAPEVLPVCSLEILFWWCLSTITSLQWSSLFALPLFLEAPASGDWFLLIVPFLITSTSFFGLMPEPKDKNAVSCYKQNKCSSHYLLSTVSLLLWEVRIKGQS